MLKEIAYVISTARGKDTPAEAPTTFHSAGGKTVWPGTAVISKTLKQGILDGVYDWECTADLSEWKKHSEIISKSGMRPDIVLHSPSTKKVILIELSVPYESRMEEAHTYKTEKYASLASSLREQGFQTRVLPIEVGERGFVDTSAYDLMKQLSISGKKRTRTLKALAEAAEKSLSWIWSRRNENKLHIA